MIQSEEVLCHCDESKKMRNWCCDSPIAIHNLTAYMRLPYNVGCTEPKGHFGPHIACTGGKKHEHLASWPREMSSSGLTPPGFDPTERNDLVAKTLKGRRTKKLIKEELRLFKICKKMENKK